ncbi:MAG: iron chelate uptake ABC transporter family permease subunit [Thermoleophilaceae bacterium]|nr:iron chelate uptake ABC transporter family permease subunit [Thermoleophilaceae bacterium]
MSGRAAAVAAAGVAAALLAALADVLQGQGGMTVSEALSALTGGGRALDRAIVEDIRLPRAAAGALAGGSLAAAAVLLQAVTRNRLADAGILGLTAGGALAVTAISAYASTATAGTTIAAAFGGVLAGALLVGALAAVGRAGPVRLLLAGMAVSLALSAVTAAIRLVRETETGGLFLWGAGSLMQLGWGTVTAAAPAAAAGLLAALLLARPLDVAVLGEAAARSLGQHAGRVQAAAGLAAAVLAAAAVAVAGPISFAGLLAAFAARAARPRNHLELLAVAVPWGAAIVLAADVAARLLLGTESETPAGIVCALIGAPVLVALARRLPAETGAVAEPARAAARRRPRLALALLLLLPAAAAASLCLGELEVSVSEMARAVAGQGGPLAEIAFDLRGPRLAVALLAGACLAAAGVLMQGVVRNPLASPDLLGVTGGGSLGAFAVLLAFPEAPSGLLPFAAFAGGVGALAVVLLLAGPRSASPSRLALTGLAVTAACTAVTALMLLDAQPEAGVAVAWLAGSTYASGWDELTLLAVPAAVLLPLALLAVRRLDVLALGDDAAAALGLRLRGVRIGLLALGASLAAAAVAVTGAIAFVGLMAPHAARLVAGGGHRRLLPLAIVLGMTLLAGADVLGRLAFAPTELPSGLVVAVVGAPYLGWLLLRGRAVAA